MHEYNERTWHEHEHEEYNVEWKSKMHITNTNYSHTIYLLTTNKRNSYYIKQSSKSNPLKWLDLLVCLRVVVYICLSESGSIYFWTGDIIRETGFTQKLMVLMWNYQTNKFRYSIFILLYTKPIQHSDSTVQEYIQKQ